MKAKRKSAFLKPFIATVVLSAGALFYNGVHAQTVKEQPSAERKTALMVDFKGMKRNTWFSMLILISPMNAKQFSGLLTRIIINCIMNLFLNIILKKGFLYLLKTSKN